MAERLTLWCLLDDDDETFPVEISAQANIHDLKKEIKKEMLHSLQNIDLTGILLYKVCHSSLWLLHVLTAAVTKSFLAQGDRGFDLVVVRTTAEN
jgi:hypothetical protein